MERFRSDAYGVKCQRRPPAFADGGHVQLFTTTRKQEERQTEGQGPQDCGCVGRTDDRCRMREDLSLGDVVPDIEVEGWWLRQFPIRSSCRSDETKIRSTETLGHCRPETPQMEQTAVLHIDDRAQFGRTVQPLGEILVRRRWFPPAGPDTVHCRRQVCCPRLQFRNGLEQEQITQQEVGSLLLGKGWQVQELSGLMEFCGHRLQSPGGPLFGLGRIFDTWFGVSSGLGEQVCRESQDCDRQIKGLSHKHGPIGELAADDDIGVEFRGCVEDMSGLEGDARWFPPRLELERLAVATTSGNAADPLLAEGVAEPDPGGECDAVASAGQFERDSHHGEDMTRRGQWAE